MDERFGIKNQKVRRGSSMSSSGRDVFQSLCGILTSVRACSKHLSNQDRFRLRTQETGHEKALKWAHIRQTVRKRHSQTATQTRLNQYSGIEPCLCNEVLRSHDHLCLTPWGKS